jgi:hypothetical protein
MPSLRRRYLAKHSSQILEMARKGAEQTYNELQDQLAKLVKDFPHLANRATRQVSRAVRRGRSVVVTETSKGRRRARRMSAAARKAVSLRMKKYWAERRKVTTKNK